MNNPTAPFEAAPEAGCNNPPCARADARGVCPECGFTVTGDGDYCPHDGQRLNPVGSPPSFHDALLGSVIDGRYEVLAVIGEGGMGRVYRVRHRTLGRSFALKVLRPELAKDANLAERFAQEARAAAIVTHPNVVQINDFGKLPTGQPYFVMELLEGRTLTRTLREEGPIEVARCISIATQVAEAIAAAHASGVIHRDLKPDNVIILRSLGGSTTIKVLDFGLARVVGNTRLTRPGVVYGTPHYMSPEQAGGEAFDHRVDIYALGVIMFELVTGRVPFEANTFTGVLSHQLYSEPPKLKDFKLKDTLIPGFEEVLTKCLAKQPDERWQSMTELARRLSALSLRLTRSSAGQGHSLTRSRKRPVVALWVKLTLPILLALVCFASVLWKSHEGARVPVVEATPENANRERAGASDHRGAVPAAVPSAESVRVQGQFGAPGGSPTHFNGTVHQPPQQRLRGTLSRHQTAPTPPSSTARPNEAELGAGDLADPWAK